LVGAKLFSGKANLMILLGPGIASAKRTTDNKIIPTVAEGLFSFNVAVALNYSINNHTGLLIDIRKQFAASPDLGGGDSYSPSIISTGLQINL
jgi:hypothetical protein